MHQVGFCKFRGKKYPYSRISECISQHLNAATDSTYEENKPPHNDLRLESESLVQGLKFLLRRVFRLLYSRM
jgi:hypothetical protein